MATTPPDPARIVERAVDLAALLAKKSYFLFGPRQTGKTTWVRHGLPHARVYDLLDSTVYLALSHRPARLAEEIGPDDRIVVLDEIQRLPVLLDEVHRLIEERAASVSCSPDRARASCDAAGSTCSAVAPGHCIGTR